MTRFLTLTFASLASLLVIGCAGTGMSGDDDSPGSDANTVATLDPQDCAAFASSMASAATTCGTSLPAGGQASVEGWCRGGVQDAALCGGMPGAGLDCFATANADDWVCSAGQPYPSCGGDLEAALGAYCLMALGNPSCASVNCEYDADCSSGSSCNSVTGQCFGDAAYCIGLPCAYDVDCPTNEKCNSAEGACVGR
jgi:hypothetical protein